MLQKILVGKKATRKKGIRHHSSAKNRGKPLQPFFMLEAETLKLNIIERLMRVNSTSALERLNDLITQAEMETGAGKSIQAIKKGELLSLDEFRQANKEWADRNHIN